MFEDARNIGLIEDNPFSNLRLPATEKKGMIQFAAWSGIRQGELFALHRDDVSEFEITISKSRKLDGTIGKPKHGATRTVPLLPPARVIEHVPERPDPFLFHSPQGRPLLKGTHGWSWQKVKARAGVETRWHDLRHFCETRLLELGLSHFDVSIQLGHTDCGGLVMERYGHPSVDAAKQRLHRAFSFDQAEGVAPGVAGRPQSDCCGKIAPCTPIESWG